MIVTYIDKERSEYVALIDVGTLNDAERIAKKISRTNIEKLITKEVRWRYNNAIKIVNTIWNLH